MYQHVFEDIKFYFGRYPLTFKDNMEISATNVDLRGNVLVMLTVVVLFTNEFENKTAEICNIDIANTQFLHLSTF